MWIASDERTDGLFIGSTLLMASAPLHALNDAYPRPSPAQALVNTRWGLMYWPVIAYALTSSVVRELGTGPYALTIGCSALICLGIQRVVAFRAQLWLLLLSLPVLVLSVVDWMPKAWTIYYDRSVIIRQWSWVLAMPLFTTGAVLFCLRYRVAIVRHAPKLFFATWLFNLAYRNISIGLGFEAPFDRFTLYAPNNENLPIFLMGYIAAFGSGASIFVRIGILLILAALSTSVGNLLTSLVALGLFFVPQRLHRTALYGLLLFLLLFVTIAPFMVNELHQLDANSGVRALFWRDAISAIVQNWGAGVGYGTEYITNHFDQLVDASWTIVSEESDDRLFVSTHSTFYDVGLRIGVIGPFLIGALLVSVIGVVRSRAAAAACAFLIINFAINPMMIIVDTQVAVALLLGWILVDDENRTWEAQSA